MRCRYVRSCCSRHASHLSRSILTLSRIRSRFAQPRFDAASERRIRSDGAIRHEALPKAALALGDQLAVVMLPGVEAGKEESQPGAEDLAEHPGQTIAYQNRPAQARGPLMPSWASRIRAPWVRSTKKFLVTFSITSDLTIQRLRRGQSRVAWSQVS